MSMAATNDTPTVAVNYFNNAVGSAYSGDTNAGGIPLRLRAPHQRSIRKRLQ
jgi:hypothetical protein